MEEFNLWSQILHRFKESCSRIDSQWIKRRRIFRTDSLIFLLFKLVANSKDSYGSVLFSLFGSFDITPSNSSFCESRSKFSSHWLEDIRDEILDEYDSHTKPQLWHGLHVYAVDGSKVPLPRELFADGFRAPSSGHCPQGLVSTLVRTKDRLIYDIQLTADENERTAAHGHLEKLSPKDLVIYDRGYLCFSLLVAHVHHGIHSVFRVPKGGAFVEVEKFWNSSRKDKIVTIDPTPPTYRSIAKFHPELEAKPIKIRLIKYYIDGEPFVLATTLLDKSVPLKSFVDLYPERWVSEEVYKGLKKTLGIENLHSKKINGIEQEIQASALLWNLTQISIEINKHQVEKKDKKHKYQANRKQVALYIAKQTTNLFSTIRKNVWKTWENLIELIKKAALPIRDGRHYPRQLLKPPTHWKKPPDKTWISKGRPRGRPRLDSLTE